jgi:hypothetical protein
MDKLCTSWVQYSAEALKYENAKVHIGHKMDRYFFRSTCDSILNARILLKN